MFSTFAIENKTDKNIAKKVLSIFEKAGKNSLPVEISCLYATEFQHFITVPNDNETLKKIEQGEEKSLNCKDWILHENQVEFLMDKILSTINEKFELHFDLYEEDFISQDKIQECMKIQKAKNPDFKTKAEKEAWYEILQCGDGENMDKCLIIANDLTKSYKKPGPKDDFFSPEFYEDIQFFDNPFELVHKYKLKEGKTIAQIICDNNGWDYSILPVYPKDFSPLFGDLKNTDDDEK